MLCASATLVHKPGSARFGAARGDRVYVTIVQTRTWAYLPRIPPLELAAVRVNKGWCVCVADAETFECVNGQWRARDCFEF